MRVYYVCLYASLYVCVWRFRAVLNFRRTTWLALLYIFVIVLCVCLASAIFFPLSMVEDGGQSVFVAMR